MGSANENTQALLVFRSNGLDCAFPLEAVREIVPMALLSSPPGTPSGLSGFLNLRGAVIPILRLDRLFDLPEQQPGLYTPLIILRGLDMPIGILVGAVRQIVNASVASLLPLPEKHVFHDCATATATVDGDVVHVLSPAAILLENERRSLADFQALEKQRLNHLGVEIETRP
jgi:purine-binding chemotaxis protein CheW